MDDSDEDKVLLEDDSMDEMHEVEGDLMESIDTNASPAKAAATTTRRRFEDGDDDAGKEDESDDSELFNGSSSSSDESEGRGGKDAHSTRTTPQSTQDASARRRQDEEKEREADDDDDDDDEPPEIPGSPLRTMVEFETPGNESARGRGELGSARQKAPNADILTIQHSGSESDGDENEEYETKETEAPRAMEFHTSSSSSDSEREGAGSEDEDDEDNNHHRRPKQRESGDPYARQDRPKTAAKELALYRGVVPTEYYEQIVQDAQPSPKKQEHSSTSTKARDRRQDQDSPREAASRVSTGAAQLSSAKYKVRVPREIEELFQYVDEFTPDEIDIPSRLQPFIPEYVPTVGLPFDGIQIPRPDNKRDTAGIAFVREPCAQSNAAELELLLAARAKNQRRKRQLDSVERIHSIEDASNRPREIDNWIASVAKVQASKPLPQVQYKKPMPSETSLMELWPEEFEIFLSTLPPIPLSKMDLDLADMIRVVCGILDIPVNDGLQIHSLHALFSLYLEVVTYEKELRTKSGENER